MHENEICDIYMASLWRGGHCSLVIDSLINQKELSTLTIICNNYTKEQFQWLSQKYTSDKIVFIRGDNAKASNEKIRYIGHGTSPFLGFVDDDLIYPHDYLEYMVAGVKKHKAFVSLHGSKLAGFPLNNYYTQRDVYKCLDSVGDDTEVDIIGSGVSLIKRDQLPACELAKLYDFAGSVSMDDIYLSSLANRYGIRRFVLKHPKNYLEHKEQFEEDNYVFDEYKKNNFRCPEQTSYININLIRRVAPSNSKCNQSKVCVPNNINLENKKNNLRQQALFFMEKKQYDIASMCFAEATFHSPKDAQLHFLKGVSHHHNRQLFEAIKCYSEALQIDSTLVEAFVNLADLQMELNLCDDALISIRAAIVLKPKNANLLTRLNDILFRVVQLRESMDAS